MTQVKVVRKSSYQGVPQWGISTSSEITPDKKTAEKWAQLENDSAFRKLQDRYDQEHRWLVEAANEAGGVELNQVALAITELRRDAANSRAVTMEDKRPQSQQNIPERELYLCSKCWAGQPKTPGTRGTCSSCKTIALLYEECRPV